MHNHLQSKLLAKEQFCTIGPVVEPVLIQFDQTKHNNKNNLSLIK